MDELDKRIFSGNDSPFDAKDDIYGSIGKYIETEILEMNDRCFVTHVEAAIAMLYRLSYYFDNTVTRKTDAMLWKHQVLSFFDAETMARGDAVQVKEWRSQIEANFDRLIEILRV